MAISPIRDGLHKMRYWEQTVGSIKPNCNRKDLWELIETKPDFFQNVDKYVKTGSAEIEEYGHPNMHFATENVDWKSIDHLEL